MNSDRETKKLLIVVGTRPEAIKMAPVYFALKSHGGFTVSICASGQHADLLQTALLDFGIHPDYQLDLMGQGQTLASLTSKAIEGLDEIISNTQPDLVLVHGDTTTAFTASLCSYYRKIPIAHVEAGLRTGNTYSPFPEEFNRQAISRIAKWHFAPTTKSVENLTNEGIPRKSIVMTGNTVVDAITKILVELNESGNRSFFEKLENLIGFNPKERRFVLITMHRRENLDGNLGKIFEAVSDLAYEFPEVVFLLPLHPNPQVRSVALSALPELQNIKLIEPLGYMDFIFLLGSSDFVLTDSGGIQEEAVTLGVNVLIARVSTERPEGISTGVMKIVGTEKEEIKDACRTKLAGPRNKTAVQVVSHVYGNGTASEQISNVLAEYFESEYLAPRNKGKL
jgi:UDP-N-acetylglucosamine 2-epimerase (non-hydrolysing)